MKLSTVFVSASVIVLASLFLGSSCSPLIPKVTTAVAVIHPTKGNTVSGVVTFKQQDLGTLVIADVQGLTPGEHGFHIHEFGDCACDDANCAGSHFNPTQQNHGGPNNPIRHVGDMGNLVADENGKAHLEYVDQHIALNGSHSVVGRSVIVHEKRDDLVSQPTGDAGARLGCGVIGIAKG